MCERGGQREEGQRKRGEDTEREMGVRWGEGRRLQDWAAAALTAG